MCCFQEPDHQSCPRKQPRACSPPGGLGGNRQGCWPRCPSQLLPGDSALTQGPAVGCSWSSTERGQSQGQARRDRRRSVLPEPPGRPVPAPLYPAYPLEGGEGNQVGPLLTVMPAFPPPHPSAAQTGCLPPGTLQGSYAHCPPSLAPRQTPGPEPSRGQPTELSEAPGLP